MSEWYPEAQKTLHVTESQSVEAKELLVGWKKVEESASVPRGDKFLKQAGTIDETVAGLNFNQENILLKTGDQTLSQKRLYVASH